ncbi:MAG: carboxypeptidase-like regulatory domain-containing protein [Melioribacteraceae bacterium]|nr:carboxypeptidase-like regulatory domain-containing protein [Melioribacteraceae bacterium]
MINSQNLFHIISDRFILLAVILLFFNSTVFSQHPEYHLNGVVLDGESNKPVASTNIQIIDENIFTTSKDDGSFEIEFEEVKSYRLKITHIGYKEEIIEFDLEDFNHKRLIVYLIPKSIDISPVIILGQNALTTFDELYEASNVLKGKELQKELGLSLAATLKMKPGLQSDPWDLLLRVR